MTLDEFFAGYDEARRIFDCLHDMIDTIGPAQLRVSKSQVAFVRHTVFARAWMPDIYLGRGHAPLVLTLGFREKDPAVRWKQVVEPAPGRFTHHLELYAVEEIDDQVRSWLQKAWDVAGQHA